MSRIYTTVNVLGKSLTRLGSRSSPSSRLSHPISFVSSGGNTTAAAAAAVPSRCQSTSTSSTRSTTIATGGGESSGHSSGKSESRSSFPRYPSGYAAISLLLIGGLYAVTSSIATSSTIHLEETEGKREGEGEGEGKGIKQPSGQKLISFTEVQKHASRDDCWVVIDGMIYDVTDFLDQHPGGAGIIVSNAGKDATKIFKPLHPPDALNVLDKSQIIGPVDPTTIPKDLSGPTEEDERIEEARKHLPGVDAMLLASDFEFWAEKVLSGTGWNYYKSAADSEDSANENERAFSRYYLRPRILNDVTNGTTTTSFVGMDTTLPLFISPAAMAKLGHPLGEVNLTKGAGNGGIVQGISINASCSLDEIMAARKQGQQVMFQIYLNKDRKASETLLKKVTELGASAIIFTVDAAWHSKRTRDVRAKTVVEAPIKSGEPKSKAPMGVSKAISGYQDSNLTWDDIKFIRANTNLPIIVKGVQCVEDVEKCVQAGVEGVILSNHGGRQCNFAPASIDILYEIRALRPDLFGKIDILLDGGVRSGADVVKALALGAKAVGMGRPFLYANGTHGQEGVERLVEIMREEITNTMRCAGVTRIEDLKPEMVGPAGPWVGANRPPWLK